MGYNSETQLIGMIDAKKRIKLKRAENVKQREQSNEVKRPDGSVSGTSYEFKSINLPDGTSKTIRIMITYWRSAEAIANAEYKG